MTALITREELEQEIAAGTVTVIDALGGEYYAKAHLPGAIALVEAEVDAEAARLLPDRDAAIVTYCHTNVRKYREGIQDWTDAGLTVESGR
ncbi:rhodanese-like domain-containing protein [Nocardia otitidiscaviarum]|uniref:rhodanese-like domain-containing protein n=1 Tax=Nocardia otitidiscaviarum TaxID=1823 RepID=UPI0018937742|nr:rhodanese-like domain-containing protein [Nocardia otitidiscaviarum]MBF6239816.1 rhodanese-like domain-containing protein [Nocardia otitidiscaviarum]